MWPCSAIFDVCATSECCGGFDLMTGFFNYVYLYGLTLSWAGLPVCLLNVCPWSFILLCLVSQVNVFPRGEEFVGKQKIVWGTMFSSINFVFNALSLPLSLSIQISHFIPVDSATVISQRLGKLHNGDDAPGSMWPVGWSLSILCVFLFSFQKSQTLPSDGSTGNYDVSTTQ